MGFWANLSHRMILREQTSTKEGYISAPEHPDLVGRQGIVTRELRPAGTIVIDNNPIDVVSEGDYITKGHKVVVTQVTGNRVVVRPVTEYAV